MKTAHIVLTIIVLGLIAFVVWPKSNIKYPDSAQVTQDSIIGCYVATIAKDVYTLNIESQDDSSVTGTLSYKNFEKDSSSGTLAGVYDGATLVGEYRFNSEGMESLADVVFKKTSDGFVRGFGTTETVGNKEVLSDTTSLSYENSPTFVKTECK